MVGFKIDDNCNTASFKSGHERDYGRIILSLGRTSGGTLCHLVCVE